MDESKQMVKGILCSQQISSCIFGFEDFRKLYHLLAEKAKEAGEIIRKEHERNKKTFTPEQDSFFMEKLPDALKLAAYVIGTRGERVIYSEESAISLETMPEDVETIGIGSAYIWGVIFNNSPNNKFEVKLNFSKSKLTDFSNPLPIPSQSMNYFQVEGDNETWVNGVYQTIISFFDTRSNRRHWLHTRHTYDLFQWLLGIPILFWILFRTDSKIAESGLHISTVLLVSVYLYIFILGLLLLKLLFNYARWIFPQHEYLAKEKTKSRKHRLFSGAIIVSALGSLIISILEYVIKK